jgi:hypothetical protein
MHAGLRHLLMSGAPPIADLRFDLNVLQLGGARYSNPAEIPGWTFARASEGRSLDGTLSFASGVPRIVPGLGILIEEARTNLCANTNLNPSALTNVSKGGDAASTLTLVDDSTALAAIGLTGNVFKLDNSAGSTNATATVVGNSTAGTAHTASCFQRGSGTGGPTTSTTGSGWGFALTAGYLRRANTETPGSPGAFRAIATAGSVVYFIFNQLEAGSFATSPIVTTGAAATRAASVTSQVLPAGAASDIIRIEYTGGVVTSTRGVLAPADTLDLGATSGGAWVNKYMQRVTVTRAP